MGKHDSRHAGATYDACRVTGRRERISVRWVESIADV